LLERSEERRACAVAADHAEGDVEIREACRVRVRAEVEAEADEEGADVRTGGRADRNCASREATKTLQP
jgi:hypothetical protein